MAVTTNVTTTYDTLAVPTLNWLGTWSAATAYNPGDAVFFNGSSYVCLVANTGAQPPNSNWDMLAQQGAQGIQGIQGPTGATGAQGAAGTPGEKWFTGSGVPAAGTGAVGDWYLDAATGDYYEKTGAAAWTLRGNLRGPQGAQGATGATGSQGIQGPTGPTGPQGATGPQGIQGIQGPIGPQGPVGPTGPEGPVGPPGLGYTIRGQVNDVTALPSQPQPLGDAYQTLNDSHIHYSTGSAWLDLGPIQGPQGNQGPQGATGAQGPVGAQGDPGPSGPAGAVGPTGPPGPQGATGPRGPQGAPGDPYGNPILAIGSIVHWRPANNTFDRYGLCKPAVVLGVWSEYYNLLSLHVLGTFGGPTPLYDQVPTGSGPGQWHFLSDCPYDMTVHSAGVQIAPFAASQLQTLAAAQPTHV